MPFAKAEGYHSKTLAYSIWHVFRIEDIVLHTLILNNSQVLERGEWQKKIGAEIITTGNELSGQQITVITRSYPILIKTRSVPVLYIPHQSSFLQAFTNSTKSLPALFGRLLNSG